MEYNISDLNKMNITEEKILSGEFGVYTQNIWSMILSNEVSEDDKNTLHDSFLIALKHTLIMRDIIKKYTPTTER